jgi:predicted regulator of Ras-like GTPase activity (Roadblock/LC7/MglB family)
MAISKDILMPLLRIEGVNAAAIYLETGEAILFNKIPSVSTSPEEIGAFAAEILRASTKGMEALNIGRPYSYRIETDKKVFLHKCIVEGKAGLGVIADRSSNIGLIFLNMEQIIDEVKKDMK